MMDVRKEQERLTRLVEFGLEQARSLGASAAAIAASIHSGLETTVRDQQVETVEFAQDQVFGVTIFKGKAKGSSTTTDLSDEAVKEAISAACTIAGYTQEDEYAGLAEADQMATDLVDLDLDHPWSLDLDQAIELAKSCEQSALSLDKRIQKSKGASLSSGRTVRVYGNSHGFMAGYSSTRHSMGCAVVARDAQGMRTGGWGFSHRVASRLPVPESIGVKAAERAIAKLSPRVLSTGKVPVLFRAEVASGLIGNLSAALSGARIYRNASFLKGKLGEKLFPDFFTLQEFPRLRQGAASCAYDEDGLATYDKSFIENGAITRYILTTYSARRLGMKTTANAGGLRNVRITNTGQTLDQLLREMDTGLLVTELMGRGVDIVTGNYSRGAAGFWVERGEIQYPVHEITIAGNLLDMFQNLVAVGSDIDARGNTQVGSLLIAEMTVGGEKG